MYLQIDDVTYYQYEPVSGVHIVNQDGTKYVDTNYVLHPDKIQCRTNILEIYTCGKYILSVCEDNIYINDTLICLRPDNWFVTVLDNTFILSIIDDMKVKHYICKGTKIIYKKSVVDFGAILMSHTATKVGNKYEILNKICNEDVDVHHVNDFTYIVTCPSLDDINTAIFVNDECVATTKEFDFDDITSIVVANNKKAIIKYEYYNLLVGCHIEPQVIPNIA